MIVQFHFTRYFDWYTGFLTPVGIMYLHALPLNNNIILIVTFIAQDVQLQRLCHSSVQVVKRMRVKIKVHYMRGLGISRIFMTNLHNIIGILDREDVAPLYSGGQLTSTIIAHYQYLLKSKYNVGGLEDPIWFVLRSFLPREVTSCRCYM